MNKRISLREDAYFVKGVNNNFEQENFPQQNEKVNQMLRNPLPDFLDI